MANLFSKGAIFLDRDGTINGLAPEHEYVTSPDAFQFLPGALDALAFLAQNSERPIIIVTNQSPIGRGMVRQADVDALHVWMIERIEAAGGRIDGVYVCPHRPELGCNCRKPTPGLLFRAARDHDLDLGASCLVGDTSSDIKAARRAGVQECYFVLTGRAPAQFPDNGQEYEIYATLHDAAQAIVRKEKDGQD
jgi:D-glycero-D-manno-heptose 1,7-bisphosphate phosphatase